MTNKIYLEGTLFMAFSILIYHLVIPYLKKLHFNQTIRRDGPASHYIKAGTPTFGGIIIFLSFIILFSLLLIEYKNRYLINIINYNVLILLLLPCFLYAVIGFIDDFMIICKNDNKGISPTFKLLIQLLMAIICYNVYLNCFKTNNLNFFGENVDLMFGYGIFIIFLFLGVTNATNLTDGLDGLLGGNAVISYLGLGILSIEKENFLITIFCFSMIIALLVFLIFNLPKASLFMGNIGSLFIGAGLVSVTIILKVELLLIFFGFPYFLETIAVIFQVWYYKKTKGKRLLKMAPLHHHLELSGFKEIEIDLLFFLINIALSTIGVLLGVLLF